MPFKTPDLCDLHQAELDDSIQVVAPIFQRYGSRRAFSGQIVTVRVFEDNSLVRTALEEFGRGKVLVVDGGASLRCALLGDQLGELAHTNGWDGIVVNGCIRDSTVINRIDIGVRALNTNPRKSLKKGQGERNIAVTFGEVTFHPNQWLYADEDGILISAKPLIRISDFQSIGNAAAA